MRSSTIFPLMASLLFVSLPISLFISPSGYTYDETCPTCQGKGTVICEACHGSGECYTCGGIGWHTCGKCEGSGLLVHWMYNLTGTTVILSLIGLLLYLGLFILSYIVSAFYLSFNEWVYEVEDMGFWFNPSFMTWLFARHRNRWARWQTSLNLIGAIYFGVLIFWLISLKQIRQETFSWGILFGIAVMSLFSWFFYKSYTSRLAELQ